MSAYVYQVTRQETGDCYIGITTDPEKRWYEHRLDARVRARTHFHRALAKYGENAFSWEVTHEVASVEEAKVAEMCLIYVKEPSYNMTDGGDGVWGKVCAPETRAKISEANKGKTRTSEARQRMSDAGRARPPISEETRKKLSVASSGRKHTEETKQLMSEIAKNRSPEHIAKIVAARADYVPSTETCEKISAAKLGKKQSPEMVERRVAPLRGRKRPPEVCAKISATKRAKKAAAA